MHLHRLDWIWTMFVMQAFPKFKTLEKLLAQKAHLSFAIYKLSRFVASFLFFVSFENFTIDQEICLLHKQSTWNHKQFQNPASLV